MKESFDDRWEFCMNCDEDLMPEWEYCPSCGTKLHVTKQSELEKFTRQKDQAEQELVEILKHLSAIHIQKRNAQYAINKLDVKIQNIKDKI